MMLDFDYELLEHPEPYDPRYRFEIWSRIIVNVVENGKILKNLIDIKWDIIVFLKYFVENKQFILTDAPLKGFEGGSIAEGIYNFHVAIMDVDIIDGGTIDKILRSIYPYKVRHSFEFALEHTNVEDIFIGLFNDRMSVSVYRRHEKYNFYVSVDTFFSKIEKLFNILV
ncbi:hypothetical protein ACFFGT_16080 [Mucilaginibacter angelicae]|uniref:Uncharacterized protein n=1 Tax=Mucilaginibacter angelicae TaxID=869718 RepID=A0ABV6L8F6_9SPHI